MVGEAMIKTWHQHIEEAERLLALSQAPKGDRTKAASYLYDAVVEITKALYLLEKPDDSP